MMAIHRQCPICSTPKTMALDITEHQVAEWQAGKLIHRVFPRLDDSQREFLKTGICSDECWDGIWGDEDA